MAIAVAEVATGRSYGTVPLQLGGVALEMVDASGFQWVAQIPEWLLEDPQLPWIFTGLPPRSSVFGTRDVGR